MGLLLCTRCAQHPFYYEKLDINLWSIQELSYVIYHYPIMLPTDLVDRKLSGWIRDELHMGILAAKLEQALDETLADLPPVTSRPSAPVTCGDS